MLHLLIHIQKNFKFVKKIFSSDFRLRLGFLLFSLVEPGVFSRIVPAMRFSLINITIILSAAFFAKGLGGQVHPIESLGRNFFESIKNKDFNAYYNLSIFSLNEQSFKFFLKNIRNQSMRDHVIDAHTLPFPADANTSRQKWDAAFLHNWRIEWRHLARATPESIKNETFIPILRETNAYGFQWETVRLLAIEILLPVNWQNERFEIKGDLDLEENQVNPRTLFLDRSMSYRIQPDKSTYSRALMFGTDPEDSDQAFNNGIIGNGSGQGDIIIRFDENAPDKLFYFCPDEANAGGPVVIKQYDDLDKPNQRHNLLLTLAYGSPQRAFQILLKDVLLTPNGALYCGRPKWIGEVPLPRGLNFPEL